MSNPIRFVLVPAVCVLASAGFFVFYPIADGDIFWHLAAGKEILLHHRFLYADPFSYSVAAAPWTDLHWLYQIIVFIVQKLTGFQGLLVFNSLMFGGACCMLFWTFRSKGMLWFQAALLLLLVYEVRYLVPIRPIVFSLFYMALFYLILESYGTSKKITYLLLLLPVQVAWVNTQGLFMLGPVIAASYLAGELLTNAIRKDDTPASLNFRREMVCAVLILLSLLLVNVFNPYGIKAFSLSWILLGRIDPGLHNIYSANIPENAPLYSLLGTESGHYAWAVICMTLVAVVVTVFSRKIRFPLVFAALCFLLLAIMAQRNIPLYIFALYPLLAISCAHLREYGSISKPIKTVMKFIVFTVVISATCIALGKHVSILLRYYTGPVAPFSFPSGSMAYLHSHSVKGPIFNADRYGGYCIWDLYPENKVFIDTRLAIRSRRFFSEYLSMLDMPAQFTLAQTRFGFTCAIVPLALVDRYFTLASFLYHAPGWRLAYTDGAEALFMRDTNIDSLRLDSNMVVDSIQRVLQKRWERFPQVAGEARYHLGTFLCRIGCCATAERVLSQLPDPASVIMRADNLAVCGAVDSAIVLMERLLMEEPRLSAVRIELARLYMQSHNFQKALENVIFVLRRDPLNSQARALVKIIRSKSHT
jgi:hypothetical protein